MISATLGVPSYVSLRWSLQSFPFKDRRFDKLCHFIGFPKANLKSEVFVGAHFLVTNGVLDRKQEIQLNPGSIHPDSFDNSLRVSVNDLLLDSFIATTRFFWLGESFDH